MITDSAVYSRLLESGLQGTYHAYREGGAPPLPWFVYECIDDGAVFADDANHAALPVYRVSLYEAVSTPQAQQAIEGAIAKMGPYTKEEYHIDSEKCDMTTYTFTYTGGPDAS